MSDVHINTASSAKQVGAHITEMQKCALRVYVETVSVSNREKRERNKRKKRNITKREKRRERERKRERERDRGQRERTSVPCQELQHELILHLHALVGFV